MEYNNPTIELKNKLLKLTDISYDSIDKLMRNITKKHGITAKELHHSFVKKFKKTPDDWIRETPMEKKYNDEVRYCSLCKKKERRNECSYGGKAWDKYTTSYDENFSIVNKVLLDLDEGKLGLWDRMRNRREKGLPKKKPGQKGYPETLNVGESIEQARKNVGAKKCWKNKKLGTPKTKIKDGEPVPNCVDANEEKSFKIEHKKSDIGKARRQRKIHNIVQHGHGWERANAIKKAGVSLPPVKKKNVDESVRIPAKNGNLIYVDLNWKGNMYTLRVFFPQIKLPSKKEIEKEIQKIYPGCKVTYFKVVDREPGQSFLQTESLDLNNFQGNYMADIVWEGNLYRIEISTESGIPSRQELSEQIQPNYPGAIVHNIYPIEENRLNIKNILRYHPAKLDWVK